MKTPYRSEIEIGEHGIYLCVEATISEDELNDLEIRGGYRLLCNGVHLDSDPNVAAFYLYKPFNE